MLCSQNESLEETEYEEYIIEEVIIEEIIEEIDDGSTHVKTEPPDDTNVCSNFASVFIKSEPLDDTDFSKNSGLSNEVDLNFNIKSEPPDDLDLPIKLEPADNTLSQNDQSEESSNANTTVTVVPQERLLNNSSIKSESASETSDVEVKKTKYNLRKTKKRRGRKKTQAKTKDIPGKAKRPAKWLVSALIYCPSCKIERKKKRRETDRRCSRCSKPYYYKCARCECVHKRIQGLARHFKYTCNDNPIFFQCKFCEHCSTNPRQVDKHMEEKHSSVAPKRRFSCRKCGRTYVEQAYRDAHQVKCTRNPVVQCDYVFEGPGDVQCEFRSRYRLSYQCHVRKMHPDHTDPSLLCEHCTFFTRHRSYLVNHIRDTHPIF